MINLDEYINNFNKGTKDTSLSVMKYFMEEYENIESKMKFIHIAGTNGKGSCTEIISNILMKQGYKVGKFLSPHLIRYNERISINGKEISNKEIIKIIEEIQPKIEKYDMKNNLKVTLFELWTIIALIYFYREKVDFVVMEVGLGGIYDATNIIANPIVSIISSIGYDHMHILGNTLSKIATQKAGIIKEKSNTIVVRQSKDVDDVFINKCNEKNNKLHFVEPTNLINYHYDNEYQYFDYKDMKNIKVILKGKRQIENVAICIEAMKILKEKGFKVSKQSIRGGLVTVIHKGRMEVINKEPLIIFDGGHNESAIKNLQETIKMYYSEYKRTYIVSILKTKDYRKIIEMLMEDKTANFVFTTGNNSQKYVFGNVLYNIAKEIKDDLKACTLTLEEAVQQAKLQDINTVSFVIGSFYIYGDVLKTIK